MIADVIAVPRFDNLKLFKLEGLDRLFKDECIEVVFLIDVLHFQNLNKKPTVSADRTWVIRSKTPVLESLKKLIPIVDNIKSGPELFVNASNLSASTNVQEPFLYNSETTLAPTGYPLIIPIIKAKEPSPGTLNKGRIIEPNTLLRNDTKNV